MSRVFVGNLAWSVTSQELEDHLSPSGGVLHADVFTLSNGRSKGSALVSFDTEESAARAIQDMTNTELNGRSIFLREDRDVKGTRPQPRQQQQQPIGQQQSVDRPSGPPDCNVHVGNLPWTTTSDSLRTLCEEFGELQHAEIIIGRDGRSRGYGSVVFCNPDDASQCISALHGSMVEGRDLTVRISKPVGERGAQRSSQQPPRANGNGNGNFRSPDNDNSSTGYKVFVGNMPWSVTWQDLKDLAQNHGDVAFSDVTMDSQGRSRGMGTVTFHELQDAYNCIEQLNGHEVEGRKLLVKEDNRNPLPSPP